MEFIYLPYFQQGNLFSKSALAGSYILAAFVCCCVFYAIFSWMTKDRFDEFFHGLGLDILSLSLTLFYAFLSIQTVAIAHHYGGADMFEAVFGFISGILAPMMLLGMALGAVKGILETIGNLCYTAKLRLQG